MANNDLQRTEYLNLLASLQPEQAINILNDRVTIITKINSDIADWLQERRKVEEAYVAGLRKLARRHQQDGAAALGIFQMPWQRIVSGTENLAASHETLATKIETDVETPLRTWASRNRAYKDLSTAQVNLHNVAKELSGAQKKAAKGGRRADTASSTIDDASRHWESQAPYVFEQLQAVDELRVNHLRDVLTQFQTHEVDSIEKNKISAESCLGALLNVETADEIRTFAARAATGGAPALLRRLSSATAGTRPASSLRAPPTPPPPRGTADGYSQRTNSFAGQDRLAPLPDLPPQKEKSKLAGLKRLGTVMNRRKSTAPPVPSSTTEEKRRTRFVPFRRGDSSRSFQDLDESGQDLTPTPTQDRPASSVSQSRRYEQPIRDLPEPPLPQTNGFPPQAPSPLESHPTGASYQPGVADKISPPAPQVSNNPYQQMALNQASTANTTDSITQAQQALSEESGFASPQADESARNFMIRDKPIEEDQTEAEQAMNFMANQLRSQAQNAGINRPQGSVRGRRDVRNTMYIPSGTEILPPTARNPPSVTIPEDTISPSPDNTLASPLQRPPPITALQDEHIGSDTASMISSRSLALPTQHPDLHEPGLAASVLETVHSTFTESGISKSFVLGEIALAYNSTSTVPTPNDSETIRIQHFELLDKVAANPIFLSQLKSAGAQTEEQAGTYTVTTTQLRRPTPMICLKYQLHMEESNLARYSPILLTPAWQVIDGQVSVILLYSLNPVFGTESLTLKNVSINVSLDLTDPTASRAQSAMMAPTAGASFRRKTSSVVWRLPEFVVKPEQDRLLVRFITQGMAKKGNVEIKFEIAGRTASGVAVERMVAREDDPFADEGENPAGGEDGTTKKSWEAVPSRMKVLSGRYNAS